MIPGQSDISNAGKEGQREQLRPQMGYPIPQFPVTQLASDAVELSAESAGAVHDLLAGKRATRLEQHCTCKVRNTGAAKEATSATAACRQELRGRAMRHRRMQI